MIINFNFVNDFVEKEKKNQEDHERRLQNLLVYERAEQNHERILKELEVMRLKKVEEEEEHEEKVKMVKIFNNLFHS